MNIKSEKGITMLSLVIYVLCFVGISAIVGSITVFFYNNNEILNDEVSSASEYNKLNLYLVKDSEENGNSYKEIYEESDLYSLCFTNGNVYTFDKENGLIYFNQMCLCEYVSDFSVSLDYSSGKEVINVLVKFDNDNISYKTSYTMK